MNHEVWLWVATAAYGIHALEEFMFDWKTWANRVLHLPVTWPDFYVTNSLVIVLGVVAAEVGWKIPEISLAFPALMVINAVFFHIAPFVVTRKFSPGLITAVLLFLPLGVWLFYGADVDGALSTATTVAAFAIGAGLMACPVVMLKLKDKPFFKQG
jgi:hypothetical protein